MENTPETQIRILTWGVVRLDYIDIQYPMQHGIGKVNVPAESTGKYKKALKGKIEYRELEY